MSVERKPTAFGDLRGWIDGASRRTASWPRSTPRSIGTSSSAPSCGSRRGPAPARRILFNNIKDYNGPTSRCRRIFGAGLSSYRRVAMMMGLPTPTRIRASW